MYLLSKEKELINLDYVKRIGYWPNHSSNEVLVGWEREDGRWQLLCTCGHKQEAESVVRQIAEAMAEGREVYEPPINKSLEMI